MDINLKVTVELGDTVARGFAYMADAIRKCAEAQKKTNDAIDAAVPVLERARVALKEAVASNPEPKEAPVPEKPKAAKKAPAKKAAEPVEAKEPEAPADEPAEAPSTEQLRAEIPPLVAGLMKAGKSSGIRRVLNAIGAGKSSEVPDEQLPVFVQALRAIADGASVEEAEEMVKSSNDFI